MKMGKPIKSKYKPKGYWDDKKNVLKEVLSLYEKHDWEQLPSSRELAEMGHSSLVNAIIRHGGFSKLREELGEKPRIIEAGKWMNLEFVLEKAKKVRKNCGKKTLPRYEILATTGHSSLAHAISSYHGWDKIRELLGEEPDNTTPAGVWPDQEYTKKKAVECMEELGITRFPSLKYLHENGYGGLANAIHRHHGGVVEFRTLLGQKPDRVARNQWKDRDYAIDQAKEAKKENGWETLPGFRILRHGYSSLCKAISAYHGGYIAFRISLGELPEEHDQKEILEALIDSYIGDEDES